MIETASWARRVLALLVDWVACTFVVMLLVGVAGWSEDPLAGLWTLLVFAGESALLTALTGGSFGKLATRLRVVRVDRAGQPIGQPVDLFRSPLRSVLVCLAIPPLVFKPDGRGLHDMAAGTATVVLQVAPA